MRALFTDGTPLAPEDVVRSGYYRPSVFQPQTASTLLLFAVLETVQACPVMKA